MSTVQRTQAALNPRARATHVAFVGAGPGDPELLTVRAAQLLTKADVIVTDPVEEAHVIARYANPDAQVVDSGDGAARLARATRVKRLLAAARDTHDGLVVRLMCGDPGTFNGLAEEALACQREGLEISIVPGVSPVAAVPAYAGIPLTVNNTGAIHVLHADGDHKDLQSSIADDTTVVVMGKTNALHLTLSDLLAAGRDPQAPVAVSHHGTTTEQETLRLTLAEAARAKSPLASMEFSALAVVGVPVTHRDDLSWFDVRPLFGWNVLIPRTKDQAAPVVEQLAEFGAQGTIVPTIAVQPPRTPIQIDKAIRGLVTGSYEWIGFTSVNAVKAVRERLEASGLDARCLAGVKVAAVGGVTSAALQDWGITPDLVPTTESSAAGLLAEWPAYDSDLDPINRVFLPRADIATDTLVAGLIDLGWEVDAVTAYRTVRASPPAPEIRDAIKAGGFDAVLFTSSSTVRNLIGIAGKPHNTTVVACIGPETAKTAKEHGLRVDVLAPEATTAALVDALADFGRARADQARDAGKPLARPSQSRRGGARRRAVP